MIQTWSRGAANENMPEAILVQLADRVNHHPWWQARANLVLRLLQQRGVQPPARILDAGCGWGTTLRILEKRGYDVAGMDISRRALEALEESNPRRLLIEADLSQALPSDLKCYDVVLALDVIEHLDDDQFAIQQLSQIVRPGGYLIVSVPALPELFSEFDEVQGHRRRYLPETLRAVFQEGSWLNQPQLFWWGQWMVRLLKRQRKTSVLTRNVKIKSPEQVYLHYLRLPVWPVSWGLRLAFRWDQSRSLAGKSHTGTSLFAVAQRAL